MGLYFEHKTREELIADVIRMQAQLRKLNQLYDDLLRKRRSKSVKKPVVHTQGRRLLEAEQELDSALLYIFNLEEQLAYYTNTEPPTIPKTTAERKPYEQFTFLSKRVENPVSSFTD